MKYSLDQLRQRRSVRTFNTNPISKKDCDSLNAVVTDINTHQCGMHFQIITNDPNPFKGFAKSYGFFKNATNYLACVVDTSFADYKQRAGFFAQQFVMKAVELGIGTCFVSGTFDSKSVSARVRIGEKLLFVVIFGYSGEVKLRFIEKLSNKIIHRNSKKPMDFLYDENDKQQTISELSKNEKQKQILEGLEAVAVAPSAMNRQPVKIILTSEGYIKAKVPDSTKNDLFDMGIAMFNFQSVCNGNWIWGNPAIFEFE